MFLIVPLFGYGGMERIAMNTVDIMSDLYKISVIVFDGSESIFLPYCDIINLKLPVRQGFFRKIHNLFCRSKAIRKIKNKKDCIYISYGLSANLANVFSGKSKKSILTVHGYQENFKSIQDRCIYNNRFKIICVSKMIRNQLLKIYNISEDKIDVLYNPYDYNTIYELGKADVNDYEFSNCTIVSHGRLEEVKNYPRLIKAFSIVRESIKDAQLLIIGDGAMRLELEKLISIYHLEKSVSLIGFRENPFAYLSKAALFVLSSFNEGLSNALIEGMVFMPVVAVDCKCGPREVLCSEYNERLCEEYEEVDYGLLVEAASSKLFDEQITYDDKLLAKAILYVLNDANRYNDLKNKARERMKVFSYDAYKEKLIQILDDLEYEK